MISAQAFDRNHDMTRPRILQSAWASRFCTNSELDCCITRQVNATWGRFVLEWSGMIALLCLKLDHLLGFCRVYVTCVVSSYPQISEKASAATYPSEHIPNASERPPNAPERPRTPPERPRTPAPNATRTPRERPRTPRERPWLALAQRTPRGTPAHASRTLPNARTLHSVLGGKRAKFKRIWKARALYTRDFAKKFTNISPVIRGCSWFCMVQGSFDADV